MKHFCAPADGRQRAEHISVWNTIMDEYNYLARHWSTFAASFDGG